MYRRSLGCEANGRSRGTATMTLGSPKAVTMDSPAPSQNAFSSLQRRLSMRLQVLLDKSAPHLTYRWLLLVAVIFVYAFRVWYIQGFYIVTYGLGIFNLNILLGFLTPAIDPETDGPELPTKADEEFRPFVRRLPEFKAWCVAAV